MTIKEYQII